MRRYHAFTLVFTVGLAALVVMVIRTPPPSSRPFVPITYFVRSDGDDSTCSGLVDASAASAPNCAFQTVPKAITVAVCTDTIKLKAGSTFDTTGFTLPDKGCAAGNPITITSTATLPTRRVTPADVSLMPRVRTTGTGAVFTAATDAGGWTLDGLEITDNAGTANINTYLDFGSSNSGISDIVFTRNYVHQKETGVNYERSAVRVMIFNGTSLDYTRNYIEDFIGYPYGSTEPHNSEALLVSLASDILFEDNYSAVWYNHIFLGGSDTPAGHTAALTSASTTSATFANVTGLAVGAFLRFSVVGTATLSSTGCTPTLTRNTGAAWVTADGNTNGNWGDSMLITSVADPTKFGITRLMNLTGDNVFTTQAANSSVCSIPNGSVDYQLYQTAKVTNIAGSVVTYDPLGTTDGINYDINALNKVPATAAWNQGDDGRIVDVVIRSNTLHVPPVFAAYLQSIGRGCPKGTFEFKNVDRMTFTYNTVTGYPAVLAMTAANQNGGAPWITVNHVLIDTNWIKPDTGYPACARSALLISDDAYLNTITPTSVVTITNNLMTGGLRSMIDLKNGGTWTINHNTVVNEQPTDVSSNDLVNGTEGVANLIFKDNIGSPVCYGFLGYPSSYPMRTILNNVLVDIAVGCSGGINVNTYGTGSALAPVPTLYSQVGFTNSAGSNYLLTNASPYHNAGTDGTDPGVVWATASAPWLTEAGTGMNGKIRPSGKLSIH